MNVSVITIVKDREVHLQNLIKGLEDSAIAPEELIVVRMGEPVQGLQSSKFHIEEHVYHTKGLPLAAARNAGANLAKGELLVYLDVDCIPCSDMLEYYVNTMYRLNKEEQQQKCILLGQVRYLPKGAVPPHWNGRFDSLRSLGSFHILRPFMPTTLPESCYELFWSLAFSIRKELYIELGGFDEEYKGWGGEDTDFAFKAKSLGILLYWSIATCFHQYHKPNDNPVQHLDSIVHNANYFYSKWGVYPMLNFIEKFEEKGLVTRTPDGYIVL